MADECTYSVRIGASPETIWAFLTDPERLPTWMGSVAELDVRPGGAFRIDVSPRDVAAGEYKEIVAHERIVFTWGWVDNEGVPPGSTTVEITLRPDGDETVLTLQHRDLPDAGAAAAHLEGWTYYLGRLQVVSEGGQLDGDPPT